MLEYGNVGMLECWNVGMLECRNVGMQKCWNVGFVFNVWIPRVSNDATTGTARAGHE